MIKLNYLLFGLFTLCMLSSRAQLSFIPLDENAGLVAENTFTDSLGRVYTIHRQALIGYQQQRLSVKQWNGLFWTHYPSFDSENFIVSPKNRMAVCKHRGELYAGASFINKDSSFSGVCKWDGGKWTSVGNGLYSNYVIHKEISVNKMVSYDGKLFVCGMFNRAGAQSVHNFVYLQNNTWFGIETGQGKVNSLHISGDTLYAAGLFNQIEGLACKNLAAFYQGSWHAMQAPINNEITGLSVLEGSLFMYSAVGIYRYKNNSWQQISNCQTLFFGSSAVYGSSLYAAGTFKEANGDLSHLKVWNGSEWKVLITQKEVSPKNFQAYFVNAYSGGLLFSGYLNALFGKKTEHYVNLFPGMITLEGRVYQDLNQNCLFDAGDEVKANALVSVDQGAYYTSTDLHGVYHLVLPPGKSSDIRIFPAPNESSICQNETVQITTGYTDSAIQLDFALHQKPLPPRSEFIISGQSGFQARHGYVSHYKLSYKNASPSYPVSIKLKYTEGLNGFKSSVESKESNSDYIVWEIYEDTEISFSFKVDHRHFQTGDQLTFEAEAVISGSSTERTSLIQEIVSAFDPNDKQCSRNTIATDATKLAYHINFQNLGNDTALQIHVVDTISRSLPMQFIQMKAYSHPDLAKLSFKVRDHAIIWTFYGIYLPPFSQAGDKNSSGFIQFEAGLENNLKVGDSILNRAQIYFDYQDPVHTNTAITRVHLQGPQVPVSMSSFQIYPNPSQGPFQVNFSPYLIQEIELFNLSGQLLYQQAVSPLNSLASINPGALVPGIYIVRLIHTQGVVSGKLIVAE